MDKWNEHDAIEDFVADTLFIKNVLESQREAEKIQAKVFYRNIKSELYPFDIDWLGSDKVGQLCNQCTYITNHRNVDVYELNGGELLSIHSLANTLGTLVIKDKPNESEHLYRDLPLNSFDIEEYSIFILLIVIVLVIGLVLYIPMRKLQKEIEHLNQMSYQVGKGQLDSRAKPLSEPLTMLAETFNKMALSLSTKVNESQVFAQAVPHELRTPLSRIQLATGILRNKCNNEEQVALIDNIDQYITDIDELCSQVIQFSKLNIQTGEDTDVAFNLNRFIESRLSRLVLNEEISVNANLTETININCNEVNLRLIIDNLLKNAVQHAKQRVSINVRTMNTLIEIIIEDDGKGIPVEDYQTIFIPYARLDDSRTRKTGGIGLGLAIVKSAVNQLNGEISVDNSRFGGALFKIQLPNGSF